MNEPCLSDAKLPPLGANDWNVAGSAGQNESLYIVSKKMVSKSMCVGKQLKICLP